MGQFIEDLQYKIKKSSSSLLLKAFLLFTALVIGLTFAIIGQQMMGYGFFAYILVIIAVVLAFMRASRGWSWGLALGFALVCVLLAMLLNMYIRIAPGA